MELVVGIAGGLVAGAAIAFFALHALSGSRFAAARRTRQSLLSDAKREAEALRREAQIESREARLIGLIEKIWRVDLVGQKPGVRAPAKAVEPPPQEALRRLA